MSPADVYAMDDDTYRAFGLFMREEMRERKRAANRARRR
jgi:hypothetical protein